MDDEGFMNGGGDSSYLYTIAESMDFEANLKIPVSNPDTSEHVCD